MKKLILLLSLLFVTSSAFAQVESWNIRREAARKKNLALIKNNQVKMDMQNKFSEQGNAVQNPDLPSQEKSIELQNYNQNAAVQQSDTIKPNSDSRPAAKSNFERADDRPDLYQAKSVDSDSKSSKQNSNKSGQTASSKSQPKPGTIVKSDTNKK